MPSFGLGLDPVSVRYRGLLDRGVRKFRVVAGGLELFRARAGDLINITNKDGGAPVWITSLRDNAKTCTVDAISSVASPTVDLPNGLFDNRRLKEIVNARDGSLADARAYKLFDAKARAGDVFTLKIGADCLFIAISPLEQNYIVSGGGASFHIEHQPSPSALSDALLPDPMGKVRDEWRVGRGAAHAYEVKKGQFIQILDVEGQQCSDFMAMNSHALDTGSERFIDSTVSRSMARSAYPQPGLHDKFFDQDINPLLAVRQDTVGRHDTYAFACTARGYEERGFPGHINCSDNITNAYAPFGIKPRNAWPAINFFFNSWIDPHTYQMQADEALSRPGDYVVMEALTDLVCVSTACPDDVDPINGWNPTDIHVRIYEDDTSIQYAVAHRNEPDEAARLTRHSPFHARTSKLTQNFFVAQDLWMPTKYDATGAVEEYWACKNAATLQDMSALRKYDVLGPDAETLLQHCMTRDISKLAEHRGLYALMCDERGTVIDDGTLFRLETAVFRWCCGSENSALHLRDQAEKLGLRVWIKSLSERMANLALQGPKSREILQDLVFVQPSRPALENVKWFGFTHARLRDRDGPLFMLTRSGFTGELGYELFCDQDDAEDIWDALIEAGGPHGLVPMGSEALNMLRTEAGLMVSGGEFTTDVDALEAGLGFAVDFQKAGFLGKAALERNQAAPRRKLVGLQMRSNDVPAHGDPVFVGRDQVGIVTSASASPQLGHAIAMARIAIENSAAGEQLEVGRLDGHAKRYPCTVTTVPFMDPKREKPRS